MSESQKIIEAPSLEKLQNEQCSIEELQSAILELIKKHNSLAQDISEMVRSGRIKSRKEAIMETHYGL